jgi:N-acetylneuraminic acid mutarotase
VLKNSDEIIERGAHSSVSIQETMYTFGGLSLKGRLNQLNKLYKRNGEYIWEEVVQRGDIPSKRAGMAMETIGKQIFISGGFDGSNAMNDIFRFDVESGYWHQINAQMPFGLRLHSLNVVQNNEGYDLVIYGGAQNENNYLDNFIKIQVDCNPFMKKLFNSRNSFDDVVIKINE